LGTPAIADSATSSKSEILVAMVCLHSKVLSEVVSKLFEVSAIFSQINKSEEHCQQKTSEA
jgi:hypothetical protein